MCTPLCSLSYDATTCPLNNLLKTTLQCHATETSMLKPVKRNPAASPAPCAHIGDCNVYWHSPSDLWQGIRELTYTSEEYRAAHNATSPGMGIVGAYLGNSTAVEGGEEPSDTTPYAPKEDCARCLRLPLRKSCGRGQIRKREKAPHPVRLCISFGLGT